MPALVKTPVNINFSQGLETKTDPFQVPVGKFLNLNNSVFDKIGRLTKRNGYLELASLIDPSATYATTFNDGLVAAGNTLQAFSESSNTWSSKGPLQELRLAVTPQVRSAVTQTQCDSVVSHNGLVCTAYTEFDGSSNSFKYTITEFSTGANIIAPTPLTPTSGTVTGSPKVFLLGNYFVIVFTVTITAANHLQYIAVSTVNPTSATVASNITSTYTANSRGAWDGFIANNNLYLAWNGSDIGGAIRLTFIDSTLTQHSTKVFSLESCEIMSVTADTSNSGAVVYAAYYTSSGTTGKILAVDASLNTVLAPTTWASSGTVDNVTTVATGGVVTIFYELANTYSYDGTLPTNLIKSRTCTQGGSLGTATTVARSIGLASKAFFMNGKAYMLSTYSSAFQPTYFLIDSSGNVASKLAYSNGGGYLALGLPSALVSGTNVSIAYLFKDLIQAVNKTMGLANAAGVYSQTGVNLATFDFTTKGLVSSEIGGGLHLTGGMLWLYDGVKPVEHGFHLWPDNVEVTTTGSGGSIAAQQYFYQVTYEWTDAAGNIHRSAPSVPTSITVSVGSSTNTVNIPTLRLTYKISNPVRIVVYRWSAAQQNFYQVTSTSAPLLNDPTVDSVQFTDTFADSSILGNNLIYTTGGVVENIGAPACVDVTLFKSRLTLLTAEDPNLLWYSKQVIEATPVETSDLFTIYTAPTTGAQGSTGKSRCIWPMDDKLIVAKKDALYYVVGNGPDNTGANNDFSDPIFIASTVGCSNKRSVIFIPSGTMFQSDKGIWLLGRDLSTTYIGAPVETFTTGATVLSAVNVPGTNQVRFTLDTGITLMYDYFFGQWGVFTNIPAVSSTLFNGLHTFINDAGQVFQENPGNYLDGAKPVLMSFTTSWMNIAGLQGYERFYFGFLLGQYLSPFKLNVQLAYDYDSSFVQNILVKPKTPTGFYGNDPLYGSYQFGGPSNVFEARFFPSKQKCESFQVSVSEMYDPTLNIAAGAGLTLSGLELVVGVKKGYRTSSASRNFG